MMHKIRVDFKVNPRFFKTTCFEYFFPATYLFIWRTVHLKFMFIVPLCVLICVLMQHFRLSFLCSTLEFAVLVSDCFQTFPPVSFALLRTAGSDHRCSVMQSYFTVYPEHYCKKIDAPTRKNEFCSVW